jgi:hypothetical protein
MGHSHMLSKTPRGAAIFLELGAAILDEIILLTRFWCRTAG